MTTHQLYQRHAAALGIDSYTTFCKLLALLDAPARVEFYSNEHKWKHVFLGSYAVGSCLCDMFERIAQPPHARGFDGIRVVLLDGTVIREWLIDEYDGIF